MHKNRNNINVFWPVKRKGTKYISISSHNESDSIPLVVLIRDFCKLVKTKAELKKLLNEKKIKINDKIIRDVNYPLSLFDIVDFDNKKFRMTISENKKFKLDEENNDLSKVIKIIGKKNLGKNKIQFNLMDGRNIISNSKASVGDSVVYDYKNKKIVKFIKMEKGNDAFVIAGKHIGVKGKIKDIVELGGKKIAIIEKNKEKINVWIKNLIVM